MQPGGPGWLHGQDGAESWCQSECGYIAEDKVGEYTLQVGAKEKPPTKVMLDKLCTVVDILEELNVPVLL